MTDVHLKPLIRLSILLGVLTILFWNIYVIIIDYVIVLLWFDFLAKRRAIGRIEVSRKLFPSRLFVNEKLELSYQVTNHSSTRLGLEFLPTLDVPGISRKSLFLNMSPGGNEVLEFRGFFYTRGVKSIGSSYMTFVGPLSLYRISRSYHISDEVIVFPYIEELRFSKEVLKDLLPGRKTQYRMLEDTTSIRNVREYSTEPLNRIHWKLSARYDKLMCKEFDTTAQGSLKLFVDLNMPQGVLVNETWKQLRSNYEEQAVDAAASILRDLKDRSAAVELVIAGKETWIESYPRREFVRYLDTLTRAAGSESPGQRIIEVLEQFLMQINQNDTVVLITMHLSDKELPLILKLRSRCSKVIILLMPYGFRPAVYRPSRSYSMPHPEAARLLEKSELLVENGVIVQFMLESDALQEVVELVP